jgi:hypothetical protein
MNQTYTKDYAEWNKLRERSMPIVSAEQIPLSVPEHLHTQFKGFAFGPMVLDDDEVVHACATQLLADGDSICNYDFSDCYLLDYHLIVSNTQPFDKEGNIDLDARWQGITGIRVRFSGQAVPLYKETKYETI